MIATPERPLDLGARVADYCGRVWRVVGLAPGAVRVELTRPVDDPSYASPRWWSARDVRYLLTL